MFKHDRLRRAAEQVVVITGVIAWAIEVLINSCAAVISTNEE
jgi:hypothetical protein